MTLDQKQKQFWNRHAKRNKNPRDPNVSVLLGAFVSRSSMHASNGFTFPVSYLSLVQRVLRLLCFVSKSTAGSALSLLKRGSLPRAT